MHAIVYTFPMSLDTPTEESRFEIVRLLGEGACGRVYHVKDRQRGRADRALKVLESAYALDNRARERFIKEILILISIDHKNVVSAYEVVQFEGKDAYTMELVVGDTLASHLGRFAANRTSVAEIDSIMRQLLLAVNELHRKKIVHRDIKLENIMLRDDGLVKLNDLGLIKVIGDAPKTDPGVLLGTAYYMPPEYIMNKPTDHRADIYACGMVLWELLSAKRRFSDIKGEKVLHSLVQSNFNHPLPDLEGERQKYARILKKALAIDPNDRFASAEEFSRAIDGIFPVEKREISPLKNRPLTAIILLIIAAAVLTILLSI